MSEIHWHQAQDNFDYNKEQNKVEFDRLIEEIKTSDFFFLDAADVNYYATQLNECNMRKDEKGKPMPYTPNEVRKINMEAQQLSSFDFLNSFIGDELDEIFDFY